MRICQAGLIAAAAMMLSACDMKSGAPSGPAMADSPIIIAHRGLSGEWPEHTIEGYRAAIEAGADFIEPDLVLTKDGVLIARHENEIGDTTDISQRPEFADRKATKNIDGRDITGWFTEDFTLAEIKTLRAKERLPQLRSTARDGQFKVPSFAEILELLADVNKGRDRAVGVYPETKHPSYFDGLGLSHDTALIALTKKFGYAGKDAPIFIQSFEVGNLKRLSQKIDLPLIQLLAEKGAPFDRPDMPYSQLASAQGLKDLAEYVDGIGPSKNMVIPRSRLGKLQQPSDLVANAHAAGLKVHPWTFRRENHFLPLDHKSGIDPRKTGDLASEIQAFAAAGVDGIFTDNTPEAVDALRSAR